MRWEHFSPADFELSEDGQCITAKTGILAEDRSVLGPELVSGTCTWAVRVNKTRYPDAHLFIGVADATGEAAGRTWGYDPATGSLYLGDVPNQHGREQKFKVCKKGFALEAGGFVGHECRVTVSMDAAKKSLAFKVDDMDPVEVKEEMPAKVRPWLFLYHEGDSATLSA